MLNVPLDYIIYAIRKNDTDYTSLIKISLFLYLEFEPEISMGLMYLVEMSKRENTKE